MRVEVVAVGTELLLGQIVDTNSAWLGETLAAAGIDRHFSTAVGDNLDRIVHALRCALARADAVVVCGGLGPTQDDITREAIAEVMTAKLVRDDAVAQRIEAMFSARGRTMAANNLRQADVPVGASVIGQTKGTAPGLICPVGHKVIYAVPGVPYEMTDMVERAVLPDLLRRGGEAATIRSRVLRTWGESESRLAELLDDRFNTHASDDSPPVTMAFLASGIEGIKVRLTAKAPSEQQALAALANEEAAVRAVLGDLVFGVDAETMEAAVGDMFVARGETLGLAESLTGGLVGSRCAAVVGATKWFRGSVVSYASDVKFSLLGVPEGPVVSADAAKAMAVGATKVLGSDVGLAVTGVAGPDEQDGQPVGTVFYGIARNDSVEAIHVRLPGDRERVRQFAAISLMDALRRRLLEER
ncbi:MAG TPA: competence/damage-inducible protein A [Acidimicrobiales bacterium]|nr:competence/damage-inducible protein A [Acidimicrobiales bacterium]